MSFPYEGPQNELRLRVRPTPHQLERMADLPMKQSVPIARSVVRKNRTTPKSTWQEREKAAKAKVSRAQQTTANQKAQSSKKLQSSNEELLKNTPAYKESEHPRDRFGRFAVKAIKSTVKGVGKVVKGTEVVDSIRGVKTGRKCFHDDVPVTDVVIEKAVAL